jgi:hypothetical protein
MFKAFIISGFVAAVIAGAASMAVANSSASQGTNANVEPMMLVKDTHGIVNCAEQVWPAIDTYCLAPASEQGEVRSARLVTF